MNSSYQLFFDFHGFHVAVTGDRDDVLADVRRDFSYFCAEPGEPSATLTLVAERPPPVRLPKLKATLQTPRNVVYRGGDVSYIDYFGKALTILDGWEQRYTIYCAERDLAHEIAFLTILSRIGQHLDAIGLHRVHALGLEAGGRAFLILLPMSGGKTTLALDLLRSKGIRLLSEDTPLISRSGEVFPFPLRIGARPGAALPAVPPEYCRTVTRMEFGPKTLIDIECFRDRIAAPCPAKAILLGEKWLRGPPLIEPASRRSAVGPFVRYCVVGLGLYQGVEFVLQRRGWEILGKAGLAFSRFLNSWAVVRRSRVYRFAMGPDLEQTANVLREFLLDPVPVRAD